MNSDSPRPSSAALYERASQVVPNGASRAMLSHTPHPVYVRSGSGARIIDADGNELIDFNNNYTSLIHGHAHPAIAEAVMAQLGKGTAFGLPTEAEINLAELLCSRVPAFERIRFMNSGTEAVMHAIKAARGYTGRTKIAKCEGAYHGLYDYAEVSTGVTPETWGEASEPVSVPYAKGTPQSVLDDVVVIPFNETEVAERILEKHAKDLAAVLFDPVSSLIGLIPPHQSYLDMLQRFTRKHNVLLVFDEVVAFRRGQQGSQGYLGMTPDLTALGKIIGGGFAVGAVAGSAEVMGVFGHDGGKPEVTQGGTFSANPVTMVAGEACMKLLTPEAFDRLNDLGEKARWNLRQAFQITGVEGQVTGEGSLFRLHLNGRHLNNNRDTYPTPDERTRMIQLTNNLADEGIFIAFYGGGCLSTATEESDIERLADATVAALRRLEGDSAA